MHREEDHGQWDYFLPGHLKWDYAWSIGKKAPDAVLQLFHPEQAEALLKESYRWAHLCGRPIVVRRTAQIRSPAKPRAGAPGSPADAQPR
jgi:hypothetical protein